MTSQESMAATVVLRAALLAAAALSSAWPGCSLPRPVPLPRVVLCVCPTCFTCVCTCCPRQPSPLAWDGP
jgi:hypothetical protein